MPLNSWLKRVYQRLNSQRTRPIKRRAERGWAIVPCQVESLEARRLLSASPVGGEFQVNTTTNGDQVPNPLGGATAMDSSGDFVVTWTSNSDVYAQRYNAAGVAQGGEFQVNTTQSLSHYSTVAMDPNGDFVVTWTRYEDGGFGKDVYAQRFNASGVAQGGELLVNTTTSGSQTQSKVAMDADGDFVITWSGADSSGYDIYAQRYSAAGARQGGETLVNTTTAGTQIDASVAMDPSGNFIVTWTSYGQDFNRDIYAQRFDATGVKQGSEFLVNSTTADTQEYSSIASDSTGNFVITWQSYNQDGSSAGIYAQRFAASGTRLGTEFQVNTFTAGVQEIPAIAMDPTGNFVITWDSQGQDGGFAGVYAQQFDSLGAPIGAEFRVNTTTVNNQLEASVAMDTAGDFVVIWNSVGQDGSGDGVFGQRYQPAVSLNGGSLQITGTDHADIISVTLASPSSLNVNYNGTIFTFDPAQVTAISMNGDNGNDVLTISSNITTPAVIQGGAGNDTLNAGGGDETLIGGTGNDWYVFGNALSSQTITVVEQAGEGSDTLYFGSMTVPVAVDLSSDTSLATMTNRTIRTGAAGQAANFENADGGSGNDTLTGNSGDNRLTGGAGNDTLNGGAGNDLYMFNTNTNLGSDTINDSGGIDSLNFSGSTSAVTVNLGQATAQTINSNLTLTLNSGSSLENAYGGSGNDLLTGNSLANTLFGAGGNDTLDGGAGDDLLAGGTGNDWYVFSNAAAPETDTVMELAGEGTDTLYMNAITTSITVDLASDTLASMTNRTVQSAAPGQEANLENVYGGAGNDMLSGNASNNLLSGGAGDDILDGRAGNDTFAFNTNSAQGSDRINDSSGIDSVTFAGSTTAVTLNLGLTTPQVVNANLTLTLSSATSIENLYGGSGNDLLTGNSLDNSIFGNAGNDTLTGAAGNDRLSGDAGNDWYVFANATIAETDTVIEQPGQGSDSLYFNAMTDAVTVDLTGATVIATMNNRTIQTGASGQAANIENVYGGSGDDILIGNASANILSGGVGQDVISGGNGNDSLSGGDGRNILIGGAGLDTLQGGPQDDLLLAAVYSFATDTVDLSALRNEWTSSSSYADRLAHLQGTLAGGANGSVTLTQSTVADDGVSDLLTGGMGQDWFLGTSLAADIVTDKSADETFTPISSLPLS